MWLDMHRLLHDWEVGLLFGKEGRDPAGVIAGEPADRGCDIQSSDNESSQAFSIANQLGGYARRAVRRYSRRTMTSNKFVYYSRAIAVVLMCIRCYEIYICGG